MKVKKRLICSQLTGTIYYATVKEVKPGIFVNTLSNKTEIYEKSSLERY